LLKTERDRAALSEEKRSEYDYNAKIALIEKTKQEEIKKANDTANEKAKVLEREQAIYEYFQNRTQFTQLQFEEAKKSADYLSLQGEEKNLFDKLANELIQLTLQRDKKIALEQEIATAAINLSNQVTDVQMKNIAKLKLEYRELIASINSAIEAQRSLDSAKSGGVGFADGGYTGDGTKYDVAGAVHKGEYVLSQSMLGKMPGIIPALESVRNGGSQSFDQSRKVEIT
jgi:hypothetical protein